MKSLELLLEQSEGVSSAEPIGPYMYRRFQYSTILLSAHTVYLCVLCGCVNNQRLLPYTVLTDWFL
jgi:hypothetical protein